VRLYSHATLDLFKSLIHLELSTPLHPVHGIVSHRVLPWTYSSHWSHTNATLDLSKPLVSHLVLSWTYPSHFYSWSCSIHLQCNLHFFAYTLAMQSMVSAFIQHPFKCPSRYIIVFLGSLGWLSLLTKPLWFSLLDCTSH
jgi:hypothetical protein